MKTRSILALIGLAATLTGFCLPWVDFYGLISGLRAVILCWPSFSSGPLHWLNALSLLALLPIAALAVAVGLMYHYRRVYTILLLVLIDTLALAALWAITGFTFWHQILYGYVVMLAGILLLHIATFSRDTRA